MDETEIKKYWPTINDEWHDLDDGAKQFWLNLHENSKEFRQKINNHVFQYWRDTLKQVEKLADKKLKPTDKEGLISKDDIYPYQSCLADIWVNYRQRPENDPWTAKDKENELKEKNQLKKMLAIAKKLQYELSSCKNSRCESIPGLVESLDRFINSTAINSIANYKIGKGKTVKLSKHELFRAFEILFIHFTNNADISESYLLANEFFLAAGYRPESKKELSLNIRKQNFDEAREALKKANISDESLFNYPILINRYLDDFWKKISDSKNQL